MNWQVDAACTAYEEQHLALEIGRGLRPPHAAKEEHAERMRRSGLFRFVTEIAVHSQEHGDADRLIGVALSQSGAVALLERGATEDELGLTPLREAAARHMPGPVPWWWTYRVRLAVR